MPFRILALTTAAAMLLWGCSSKPEAEKAPVASPSPATVAKSEPLSLKDNKGGHVDFREVSEDELGLPFYPGSAEKPKGSSYAETDSQTIAESVRTTKDAPDKVTDFYKPKLTSSSKAGGSGPAAQMSLIKGTLPSGADVTVSATAKKGEDTEVSITVTRQKQIGGKQ